ncbi:MAG: potassium transporter TrkH [Bacteroidetes bacterium QS_3_64_15]|nr:MAG: potassium transporter TrkH [Bacteroidetes bacterium QS_3_64_15]
MDSPTIDDLPARPRFILRSWWRALSPSRLFIGSFLLLIGLGTVGFMVLPGLYAGPPLNWVDALFTATSAVCVTGLIVVDTAEYFTTWGQAYILLLIQIGGLGIIAFTSAILVTLGQRLSLRHEALAGEPAEMVGEVDYQALTEAILRFTFVAELIGGVLLYVFWIPRFGWGGAVWHSIFHTVSAFCNAGFSTFTTSLEAFQANLPLLGVVMTLIVLGGLGFLTLEEVNLWRRKHQEQDRFRLSIHSQIVLGTSAFLIVTGWITFTAFEWHNTLAGMTLPQRLVNGLFASITPRTAGFNTIPYGETTSGTNFLTIVFMMIGGSPGSTAGGIKTTTFALLGLLAWSRLRGSPTTSISGRSIPDDTLQKAMGLFIVAFGIVTAGIFLFSWLEVPAAGGKAAFLTYMFEAVSAFNTVGLSMGATGNLSDPARLITVVLMFIGRVGTLTFVAAMARTPKRIAGGFRYAYEDVSVG